MKVRVNRKMRIWYTQKQSRAGCQKKHILRHRQYQEYRRRGQGSIARYAKEEARIQEAAMPLVMNRIEASKRKTSLTEEEIQLLQKVVSAESRGESSETQYTVACVVLNRIESDIFPDTLAEVIVQSGQFACVENGAVYSAPITESVAEAVNKALDNNTVDENVLWFRSGHYHGFHNRAFRLDRMYFSQM